MTDTKMPPRVRLGEMIQATVMNATHYSRHNDHTAERMVLGFRLPYWQRPLVWSDSQMISFLESLWLGIPVGTYSYVQNHDPKTDGLLIDGQQRMTAIERYINDGFPVFGYHWSQVTQTDRRRFEVSTVWPCYIVSSSDEEYLKSYYNLMNFGGTAHTEGQRA